MEAEASGMMDYASDFVNEPDDGLVGREEFLHTIDMLFERIKRYVDEQDSKVAKGFLEMLPRIDSAFDVVATRLSDLEMRDGTVAAYREWVVSEAQRLGIKPSEVVKRDD